MNTLHDTKKDINYRLVWNCCSYLLLEMFMMKLILNFWGTWVVTLIFFIQTYSHKGKVTGNNSSICGSTPPRTSTHIPFFGILRASCKYMHTSFLPLCPASSIEFNSYKVTKNTIPLIFNLRTNNKIIVRYNF